MRKVVKFWAVYLVIGGGALALLALALSLQYNAFDRASEPVSRGGDVGISSGDLIVYVDGSRPDDNGDGLSWSQAKKTVDAAFNVMKNGSAINRFIKIAEYLDEQNNPIPYTTNGQLDLIETAGVNFNFNLTVQGGYRKNGGIFEEVPTGDRSNTIISGANRHRIFAFKQSSYTTGVSVSFLRLTLTKGLADSSICAGCGIQGGGAIYAENLSINISDVLVSNSLHSTSSRGGGAFDFFNTNNEVKNCSFVNNSSNRGGTAVLYISSLGLLSANKTTVQDSSFTNNFSTGTQVNAHIVYVQGGSYTEAKIKDNYFSLNARSENQGNTIIRALNFNMTNRTVEISGNHFIENGGPTLSSIISLENIGTNSIDLNVIRKYSVRGNYFRNNITSTVLNTGATGTAVLFNSFSNNIISNNSIVGQSITTNSSNVTPLIINNTFSNNRFLANIPNTSIFRITVGVNSLNQGNRLIAINNIVNERAVGDNQLDLPNYYFYRYVFDEDGMEAEPPDNVDRIVIRFCKRNLFPIFGSLDPEAYITKDIKANYDFKTKCIIDEDDTKENTNLKQLAGEIQFLDINENDKTPTGLAFDPDAIYKIDDVWRESININIDRGADSITISTSPQNLVNLINEDFLSNSRLVDIPNHGLEDYSIDLGAIEYQSVSQRVHMRNIPVTGELARPDGQKGLGVDIAVVDSQGKKLFDKRVIQGRKGFYLLPTIWELKTLMRKGSLKGHKFYVRPYGCLAQEYTISSDQGLSQNNHIGGSILVNGTYVNDFLSTHLSGDILGYFGNQLLPFPDGVVGLDDLNKILNNFAQVNLQDKGGDLNGNYIIELNDLAILLVNFAKIGVPWPL